MVFGPMKVHPAKERLVDKQKPVRRAAPVCSKELHVLLSKPLLDALMASGSAEFPSLSKKFERKTSDTPPEARDAW